MSTEDLKKKTILSKYANINKDSSKWKSPFRQGVLNPEKRGINTIDSGNVEVNKIKLAKRKLDAKSKVRKLKEKVEDVVDVAVDKLQGVDPELVNGSNSDKNSEKEKSSLTEDANGETAAKEDMVKSKPAEAESDDIGLAGEEPKGSADEKAKEGKNPDVDNGKKVGVLSESEEEEVEHSELVNAIEQQTQDQRSLDNVVRESRFAESSSSFSFSSSSSSSSSSSKNYDKPKDAGDVPFTAESSESDDDTELLSPQDPNLKQFESKPKLLSRYVNNVQIARNSQNRNKVTRNNALVGVGAGLALTDAQLMAIAQKRVKPLLSEVDAYVKKQNEVDLEQKKQEHAEFAQRDQTKVKRLLGRYKTRISKQNKKFEEQHNKEIGVVEFKEEQSSREANRYLANKKEEIAKDEEDAKIAEEEAKKLHEDQIQQIKTDSENMKKQKSDQLEDVKETQKKETVDAAKFDEDGHTLQQQADDKEKELQDKNSQIEEMVEKLKAAISAKHSSVNETRGAIKQKKTFARSLAILSSKQERAASNNNVLRSHVSAIKKLIDEHKERLNEFSKISKEKLPEQRKEAITAKDDWEKYSREIREREARKQEEIRIQNAAERKRLKQEAELKRAQDEESRKIEVEESKKRINHKNLIIEQQKEEQKRIKEERKNQKKLERLKSKRRSFGLRFASLGAGIGLGGAAIASKSTNVGAKVTKGAIDASTTAGKQLSSLPETAGKAAQGPATAKKPDTAAPGESSSPTDATNAVPKESLPVEDTEIESLESHRSKKDPVFTEFVDARSTVAPSTKAPSSYDEVVSYKTISKDEYEAHKEDPNYMVQ